MNKMKVKMKPVQAMHPQPEFLDVMVDLETLGTRPGCVILSIGAVAFDPTTDQLGPEFYTAVNRHSCTAAGLEEDPETLQWWSKQPQEARKVLEDAADLGAPTLLRALIDFADFLERFGLDKVRVWGNGADFDNAILDAAYHKVGRAGMKVPWKFYNSRCYRTLKNVVSGPSFVREGTYHNALDDAKSQARHALMLLEPLEGASPNAPT